MTGTLNLTNRWVFSLYFHRQNQVAEQMPDHKRSPIEPKGKIGITLWLDLSYGIHTGPVSAKESDILLNQPPGRLERGPPLGARK
eukprot:7583-Pelagomonas_calceolata.AAC.2